ncbi:MAG: nuclear transport factor 2 family protein [Pseudomonadota bacterium]
MYKQKVEQGVAAYFAALSAMDEAGWLAVFARNGALHDPADAPPCIGEEALRGFFRAASGAFASLSIRPENLFVCGSQAAVKFHGEGVGKNGRAVSFDGIDLFDMNVEGRIQRVRGYWDAAALFAQLQA